MSKPRFQPGDEVDLSLWNDHASKATQFRHPCIVLRVRPSRSCESGYLVQFRDAKDDGDELDQNWLRPADGDLFGPRVDRDLILD